MAELIDGFMPVFDVRERHGVDVRAPAALVLRLAREFDLNGLWPVRFIFWLRGVMLRAGGRPLPHQGIVEYTRSLGWGLLAEAADEEIVMGALTQPWQADVVFRPIASALFASYGEADHVKIAWNLRVVPVGADACRFSTETRVVACDATARAHFRRYWRLFSVGIIAIRLLMLPALKRRAERAARLAEREPKHA